MYVGCMYIVCMRGMMYEGYMYIVCMRGMMYVVIWAMCAVYVCSLCMYSIYVSQCICSGMYVRCGSG
jgi:hypothetical protein